MQNVAAPNDQVWTVADARYAHPTEFPAGDAKLARNSRAIRVDMLPDRQHLQPRIARSLRLT